MILDDKKPIKDYKGQDFKDGNESFTMKSLAIHALEGTKIEDPNASELAGVIMIKVFNNERLADDEIDLTKRVMMGFFHQRILGYISKQFEDANTKG